MNTKLDKCYFVKSSVETSMIFSDSQVVFAFDNLVVNGSYDLKGQFGWWALDSQGEQASLPLFQKQSMK